MEQWRLARWARRVTALVRAASARRVLGGTSNALDVCIAAAATIAAVVAAIGGYLPTATQVVRQMPGSPRPPRPPVMHVNTYIPGTHLAVPLSAAHLSPTLSLAMAGVVLTTAPLAFRRTYPTTAFCVIVLAIIATTQYSTAVTIAAALDYPKIGPQIPGRLAPLLVLLPTVALGAAGRFLL